MDRVIVYPGAIPLETDILSTNQNAMIAIGVLIEAAFGRGTFANGLACTAGTGLTVVLGPGVITNYVPIESTSYSDLATNSNSIVKMGISTTSVTTTTLTAPATVGQTINYLIEAQLQESDTGSVVIPYYNAANPSVAFSGPAGSGAAQNTLRTQAVSFQVKAGTAATVGTQVTPSVDAGWTGLYVISVNNGAVSLTSANITTYPTAPFLPAKLPQLPKLLMANLNLYVSQTGNDAHSGLTTWDAFATMQAAYNWLVKSVDLNGYTATINLAGGTYTTGLVAVGNPKGFVGNNATTIVGSGAAINITNGNAITATNGASLVVGSGLSITTTGSGPTQGNGLYAQNGASISYSGLTFGACGYAHVSAAQNGVTNGSGAYTVSGSAPYHVIASDGQVFIGAATITFTGSPNFSTAFAQASFCGVLTAVGLSFSGTVTGTRFNCTTNGVVYSNGATLPGSTAGTSSTGGVNL